MFRLVAFMLLLWLAYCLTPLGEIMSDIADRLGYQAPFQKKEMILPKLPKPPPKKRKW